MRKIEIKADRMMKREKELDTLNKKRDRGKKITLINKCIHTDYRKK